MRRFETPQEKQHKNHRYSNTGVSQEPLVRFQKFFLQWNARMKIRLWLQWEPDRTLLHDECQKGLITKCSFPPRISDHMYLNTQASK